MTRKVLTLAVVLVVSGLAPATASAFCSKMPCCVNETEHGPIVAATADCCATISGQEAPPQDLAVPAKATITVATSPAVLPIAAAVKPVSAVRRAFAGLSPPATTGDRLSSLSTFRI